MQNLNAQSVGQAVIIGAGPAGLTAAYELLARSNVMPIVLEMSDCMGGISRTVNYKGNRIDIGGHRFFSKSDRVMQWWLDRLPMQAVAEAEQTITYHRMKRHVSCDGPAPDPEREDNVMLVRPRKSRIYYLRRFFEYPITLSKATMLQLGAVRTLKIGLSYMKSAIFPLPEEETLEQFLINRFGRELYKTFFESYTEKVWGVPCNKISAAWGAQRIKGLSVWKMVRHAAGKALARGGAKDLGQKDTETSLIEQFLYPKYGPGQMWDEVARQVRQRGGTILTRYAAESLIRSGNGVQAVRARNLDTGESRTFRCDYVFSTMPVRHLLRALDPPPPDNVLEVGDGLVYRDFITVGLLLSGLKIKDETGKGAKLIKDNWIYIQEPDVLVGRLQIFNNWSPYMVADSKNVWIGLEYFCNDTDRLWKLPDGEMVALAREELSRIGIIDESAVLDSTVIRIEKTYPAYFGTYDRFEEIRAFVDGIENLFLVGRNGMHRYNNQDHSMLTAMIAVDNIIAGKTGKLNIWEVNTEQDYHEEKAGETQECAAAATSGEAAKEQAAPV